MSEERKKTAYEEALEQLETVKQQQPAYVSSYEQQARELYEQLLHRPRFTYDARTDALYQTYKDSYVQQGKQAMAHSMGQAAALTGGYGSSYSQSVGQQQYNAYLQKLSEVFPETYALAYQQYEGEGKALQNQYSMVQNLSEKEYQQYQDRLAAYYRELEQLQERADVEYDRQVQAEQTEYDRQQDAYEKQQDAYDRLTEMMTTMGYVPTEAEMQAAGMSQQVMEAYRNYYQASVASSGGGYYVSSSKKSSSKSGSSTATTVLNQAKEALSRTGDLEQVCGGVAKQVSSGAITAAEGRKVLVELTNTYYNRK